MAARSAVSLVALFPVMTVPARKAIASYALIASRADLGMCDDIAR